ncbi:enoyl-CoA hydratase [Rhodosalinus halophilus]|uniref:Enoyl-CoA hydratase n=1 Tax=Rhodosalinus halophilus TaxID=2259333 RepID=A0A365U915_9RHOB|nr:enoyl-CoA hydratase-related protein [Rhodosalinus halophilus]RBI85152.1 enoyl-CoA hydratase [Rhodosalinus halophilus]
MVYASRDATRASRTLPATSTLDLELEDGWLFVWLNEPSLRNPLSSQRVADLARVCETLALRPDIRGVVFRGRGGIFSAGGDLSMLRAAANGEVERESLIRASRATGALLRRVATLPQLTVMAVEGEAVAGGCGLVAAGDVVVAERGARFCFSETRMGLVPAQIAPVVMTRLGCRVARRLLLLGDSLTSEEAQAAGLADVVVDGPDALDGELAGLRAQARLCAPGAVSATKRLLMDLPGLFPDEQLDMAAQVFADQLDSAEGRDGLESFFGRRPPGWVSDGEA